MKHLNFLLIFVCLILCGCCRKSAPNTGQRDKALDIKLQIINKYAEKPLSDVMVQLSGGSQTSPGPTNAMGYCTLTLVRPNYQYDCSKNGFTSQQLQLIETLDLKEVTLYFKKSNPPKDKIVISGRVLDKDRVKAEGIKVECEYSSVKKTVNTDSSGKYDFEFSKGNSSIYNLKFFGANASSTINIGADQDTSVVDVYISGINKKDKLDQGKHPSRKD